HRWHFDPRTLADLANRCDFDVKQVRHFSAEYGPFGIIQGIATKLGGGHVLFTRLVRLEPLRLIREGSFSLHLVLFPFAVVQSVLLEALAAVWDRGGALVVTLKPRLTPESG